MGTNKLTASITRIHLQKCRKNTDPSLVIAQNEVNTEGNWKLFAVGDVTVS